MCVCRSVSYCGSHDATVCPVLFLLPPCSRRYWANTTTKETSWEPPCLLTIATPQSASKPESVATSPVAPKLRAEAGTGAQQGTNTNANANHTEAGARVDPSSGGAECASAHVVTVSDGTRWKQHHDASGKPFFVNQDTHQSTWTAPADFAAALAALESGRRARDASASALVCGTPLTSTPVESSASTTTTATTAMRALHSTHGGTSSSSRKWQVVPDESDTLFFLQQGTNATAWSLPRNVDVHTDLALSSTQRLETDPTSGAMFVFDEANRKTVWVHDEQASTGGSLAPPSNPDGAPETPAGSATGTPRPEQSISQAWTKHAAGGNGVYYFNPDTGQSTWTRPDGYVYVLHPIVNSSLL